MRAWHLALVVGGLTGLAACSDRGDDGSNVPTRQLVATLRIGAGDEGPTSFSVIKGIDVDARGRIFIYDRATQDIRVFGPDGAYIQTIGRKGRGPGELLDAEGLVIARDGNLWVRDAANSRFSVFSTDGQLLHTWQAQYCWSQGLWEPRLTAGHIVDWDCQPRSEERTDLVLAYRTDRSGIDTLGVRRRCGTRELSEAGTWITRTANSTSYRQIPYAPRPVSAIGPSGEVWCAPNSAQYALVRHAANGDSLLVTRAIPPIPVTARERDSIIAGIEERGPTGLDFSRIPDAKPVIQRLTVDDDGRLWVRRQTLAGDIVFDVIAAAGTVEMTVVLGKFESGTWTPFVVRGDDVYLVLLNEDDVPQVARFTGMRGESRGRGVDLPR